MVYSIETEKLVLILKVLTNSDDIDFKRFIANIENCVDGLEVKITHQVNQNNDYYKILRFGFQLKSMSYPIIDGGFVNWISKFTQNKKRKLLISGIRTELMFKIMKDKQN